MRTNANTKRELAISSAILDVLAAQIVLEADHGCMPQHQADALATYARGIRNVAESLFIASQPKPGHRQP